LGLAVVLTACGSAPAAAPPAKVHVGLSASFVRAGAGSVWVTDRSGGRLVRVDPATGRIKAKIGIPDEPFGVALGAGSVWVGSRYGSKVTRLNARTNRRQARIRVGINPYALAYGAGTL